MLSGDRATVPPHYKVLMIDERNHSLRSLCARLAEHDITVTQLKDGEKFLEGINQAHPDLILLGVDSQYEHGLELCRQIKKNKKTKDIPVILVSDNHSIETVLQGYDSGALDFVMPAMHPAEVLKKIEIVYKIDKQEKKLKEKAKKAKETAFNAMADASELGQIIQFMDKSLACESFESLAQRVFDVYKNFNVNGCIVFHTSPEQELYFSDDGLNKPLELALVKKSRENLEESIKKNGRFHTFNSRILVNGTSASILIRNCPSDKIRQGRLRDILGALINGIESKACVIQQKVNAARKNKLLLEVLDSTRDTMAELSIMFETHEKDITEIMDVLMSNMQMGLSILGLTEEQENYFTGLLESSMQRLVGLYTNEIAIEGNFRTIIKLLKKLSAEF